MTPPVRATGEAKCFFSLWIRALFPIHLSSDQRECRLFLPFFFGFAPGDLRQDEFSLTFAFFHERKFFWNYCSFSKARARYPLLPAHGIFFFSCSWLWQRISLLTEFFLLAGRPRLILFVVVFFSPRVRAEPSVGGAETSPNIPSVAAAGHEDPLFFFFKAETFWTRFFFQESRIFSRGWPPFFLRRALGTIQIFLALPPPFFFSGNVPKQRMVSLPFRVVISRR